MHLRKSDRLKQRRTVYDESSTYFCMPEITEKNKSRTANSQIKNGYNAARHPNSDFVATTLRCSARLRKNSYLADYVTDNSSESDGDFMSLTPCLSKRNGKNSVHHERIITHKRRRKRLQNNYLPRREGLRPRRSGRIATIQIPEERDESSDAEEEQDDEAENDDALPQDNGNETDDKEEEVDDDDKEDEEEQGRKRYDLRDRASIRRVIIHYGMSSSNTNKNTRKKSSQVHKRPRISKADESDDSYPVPELFGGSNLNAAASGWTYQDDMSTSGPSTKLGADFQPLQIDENISFDDIGGLSDHINAMKEMVFFPLLYPEFFKGYHITPPRGVLLCGPPGTGKTLIAKALACAASKSGKKVSFYMRKGADILSKWVGESERQLKILFEEAQKNQPSIIFFDEIDGLAPVRSCKQEQVHNSIVSTLLALMDGLDSRGQVVLLGATNRVDSIDGALRRPGRFDREFYFSLPGHDARAEILDIHMRKWKEPPSKDFKLELAASCVGYCGADLKALCTEAAIRAFREKYPQVYTSDDKFIIDVDSVKVEKHHFLEAMKAITPGAHRGSTVHSRPLSSVLLPCLGRHVRKIMECLSDIFPYVSDSNMKRLSILNHGCAFSFVHRPRLLICGNESVGLDHVAPAVLHELEKFPVHSIGLSALFSNASSKLPEEALVHVFREARRKAPSILYFPQFQLWWDTAYEQLKAVLMTLLEELPSDSPILLLGTSTKFWSELDEDATSVFTSQSVYLVDKPTKDDKVNYIDQLVDVAFSIPLKENTTNRSKDPQPLTSLLKAPKEASLLKASELKGKSEEEQHALRRLRMCLRDVCNWILYDKRFKEFHYTALGEDDSNYSAIVRNPKDVATLLKRVDSGKYLACASFLKDFDLIVANAEKRMYFGYRLWLHQSMKSYTIKKMLLLHCLQQLNENLNEFQSTECQKFVQNYHGDDYKGSRIVSRAHELRDMVHGMLSQMDPTLVAYCDKIAEQGGPVFVSGETKVYSPIVQFDSVTPPNGRLRNALSLAYEAQAKRNTDHEQPGSDSEETARPRAEQEEQRRSSADQEPFQKPDSNGFKKGTVKSTDNVNQVRNQDPMAPDINVFKEQLLYRIAGYGVPQLEMLYSRIFKGLMAVEYNTESNPDSKLLILRYLLKFVEDDDNL